MPRLQQVPHASYTCVTGGAGEAARSPIGQINAQAVWGLAAALRFDPSYEPALALARARYEAVKNCTLVPSHDRDAEAIDRIDGSDIGPFVAHVWRGVRKEVVMGSSEVRGERSGQLR